MSVHRNRTPRMAAVLAGAALGATFLTTTPAAQAVVHHAGLSHSAVQRVTSPTTVVKRLSMTQGVEDDTVLIQGTALATNTAADGDPAVYKAADVKFGGSTVTDDETKDLATDGVEALNATTVLVTVPAATAATATAGAPAVTVLAGDATKGPKFTYLFDATVTTTQSNLSGLAPVSETGLEAQTIAGTNFTKKTKVIVGGKTAKVTASTATALTVNFPAGLVGLQDVVVNDGRTSLYVGYVTYTATAPTVTADDGDAIAQLPTKVTLTGTHLDLVTGVTFDGVKAAFARSKVATSLTVTVPKGAAVTGADLVVSTKYGATATYTGLDRVDAATPTVTSVNGASQSGGTVIINGTNLLGLKSVVLTDTDGAVFRATSIRVESATKATATLPKLAADDYDVVATTVAPTASTAFSLTIS